MYIQVLKVGTWNSWSGSLPHIVLGACFLGCSWHQGFFYFTGFVGIMLIDFCLDRPLFHEYYSLRILGRASACDLLSEPGRGF